MRFAGLSATTEPGITILLALVLCAIAAFLPKSEGLFRRIERSLCGLASRKGIAVGGIFVLVIAVRLALLPLLPVPNPGIHDEFSYLLMADTFAHGRLANPSHPLWMSFETFHVLWFPSYASKYPPAQGAVLALGQIVGHAWIGVLLSAAAMCAAIVWALQTWMPARWAFLAGILAAMKLCIATYWINSYWGGAVAGFGGALAVGALGRLLRKGSAASAALLALGIAILLNSRPYEALFFCIPVAVVFYHSLLAQGSHLKSNGMHIFAATGILIFTITWMAYYNWRVTGNPLEAPYSEALRVYDRSALFLWQKPKPPEHYNNKEFDVFYNRWGRENYDRTWDGVKDVTWQKLTRCNVTFAWPGLIFAVPGLLFAHRDRRQRVITAIFVAVALGFLVTAWSNPHYAAPAMIALFGLVVQGMRHLRTMTVLGRPIGAALSRVLVLALVVDVSSQVAQRISDPLGWGGWGLGDRDEIQRALEERPGKHLVMVRYVDHHSVHDEWVYNEADLDRAKVLWARDLGPEQDAKLFAYYQDRSVWLVEPGGDSVSLMPFQPGPVGDYDADY